MSSILTKGKHNSPRILVARSPAGRAREKNERKEEEREKEWERGRRREIVSRREKRLGREGKKRTKERVARDNKPGELEDLPTL